MLVTVIGIIIISPGTLALSGAHIVRTVNDLDNLVNTGNSGFHLHIWHPTKNCHFGPFEHLMSIFLYPPPDCTTVTTDTLTLQGNYIFRGKNLSMERSAYPLAWHRQSINFVW